MFASCYFLSPKDSKHLPAVHRSWPPLSVGYWRRKRFPLPLVRQERLRPLPTEDAEASPRCWSWARHYPLLGLLEATIRYPCRARRPSGRLADNLGLREQLVLGKLCLRCRRPAGITLEKTNRGAAIPLPRVLSVVVVFSLLLGLVVRGLLGSFNHARGLLRLCACPLLCLLSKIDPHTIVSCSASSILGTRTNSSLPVSSVGKSNIKVTCLVGSSAEENFVGFNFVKQNNIETPTLLFPAKLRILG